MNIKHYCAQSNGVLPREKLKEAGVQFLSDAELLAILLGSGIKGSSVFSISKQLRELLDTKSIEQITLKTLQKIPGLGNAKAMCILSALEIGRRMYVPRKWQIRSPLEVLPLLTHYSDREKEHFIALTLNGAHEVIAKHVVSVGLLNRTLVHPREVFGLALADRAQSIILAHNHPSGNLHPSKEDIEITSILVKAGKILDIEILDHIIFYTTEYFSFYSENMLGNEENKETSVSA